VTMMLAFFEGILQPTHLLVILIIGLLIYGKRLPELGRSLGKGLVEFKKGLKGLEDDMDSPPAARTQEAPPAALQPPPRIIPKTPRFEDVEETHNPPTTPPVG